MPTNVLKKEKKRKCSITSLKHRKKVDAFLNLKCNVSCFSVNLIHFFYVLSGIKDFILH